MIYNIKKTGFLRPSCRHDTFSPALPTPVSGHALPANALRFALSVQTVRYRSLRFRKNKVRPC